MVEVCDINLISLFTEHVITCSCWYWIRVSERTQNLHNPNTTRGIKMHWSDVSWIIVRVCMYIAYIYIYMANTCVCVDLHVRTCVSTKGVYELFSSQLRRMGTGMALTIEIIQFNRNVLKWHHQWAVSLSFDWSSILILSWRQTVFNDPVLYCHCFDVKINTSTEKQPFAKLVMALPILWTWQRYDIKDIFYRLGEEIHCSSVYPILGLGESASWWYECVFYYTCWIPLTSFREVVNSWMVTNLNRCADAET